MSNIMSKLPHQDHAMHIWWYSAGTKLFMSETASTTRDKEGVGVVSQHRMHGIAVRVIAAEGG